MRHLLLVIKWRGRNQSANIIEIFDVDVEGDGSCCDDYIRTNIVGSPASEENVQLISNVVQTVGRATFNGKNVLNVNRFKNVTVLMTSSDLTMCKKYKEYVTHVTRRMQQGDTFQAAVTGANEKIRESANFLRHSKLRELERIRGVLLFCHSTFSNYRTIYPQLTVLPQEVASCFRKQSRLSSCVY
ncbi:hypothetical protein ACHAXA_000748 [Cyclostephanos tholiformis]|uniref:Uncharacterized protein n=1 Tax=Cyclostephanos tholiformis TaxID=382380 RepID=A0ABD3RVI9_9STRA